MAGPRARHLGSAMEDRARVDRVHVQRASALRGVERDRGALSDSNTARTGSARRLLRKCAGENVLTLTFVHVVLYMSRAMHPTEGDTGVSCVVVSHFGPKKPGG